MFVAMVVAVSVGQAQQVAAPQVLTLDQDRLYNASLYGKALEARSQAATQDLARENRQIEADLSAEEASLTTQRPALTAAIFAKLATDFDKKVETIRAAQDAKAKQLVTDRDAGRKQFFDAAVPILAEVMRSLGAYAILNRGSVVLSFDSIDVTDRAIAALDARIGDGTKTPAPETADPESPAPTAPSPTAPAPNP
jgi:Skp family chaperone for outer membrane proteins